jgi:hypothetical protein
MKGFKQMIKEIIIPIIAIAALHIVKTAIRYLIPAFENHLEWIIIIVYLRFLARKAKTRKLLAAIIAFKFFIIFNHVPTLTMAFSTLFSQDYRLTTYLPVLLLIIISELLLSNQSIFFLIDRRVFLTIFRVKHLISLILVPRLWFGDQSVVLRSQLYQTYEVLFWGSTLIFFIWIVYESAFALLTKRGNYPTLIPSTSSILNPTDFTSNDSPYFSHYRQTKFELVVLFSLNLFPCVLFLAGDALLMPICLLVVSLVTLTWLNSLIEPMRYQESMSTVIKVLMISKVGWAGVLMGMAFEGASAVYRGNRKMERKEIERAKGHDRYYESEQEIERQVAINFII